MEEERCYAREGVGYDCQTNHLFNVWVGMASGSVRPYSSKPEPGGDFIVQPDEINIDSDICARATEVRSVWLATLKHYTAAAHLPINPKSTNSVERE